MVELGVHEFDELVAEALDNIPAELAVLMDNVAIFVEDELADEPDLLGLYEGIPLTERYGNYVMTGPDRITIFRRPLLALCTDADELVREVRITVVHEIAHHFGLDDDRLHDLGYG